jgi:hypothetical protein
MFVSVIWMLWILSIFEKKDQRRARRARREKQKIDGTRYRVCSLRTRKKRGTNHLAPGHKDTEEKS